MMCIITQIYIAAPSTMLWVHHPTPTSVDNPRWRYLPYLQAHNLYRVNSCGATVKVIPQFCIAHFYCAHLITYNFIHYTYRLKKNHFMTILCYFKTSLVTFVQRITLKSMFSKKAYKSVARVPCVCSIFIYLYFTF